MTITIGGGLAPASLHMWVTQFGWDGMVQTNSSYFQQVQDVAVVGGVVTVQVPVDGLITLTTVQSSTWLPQPARTFCCCPCLLTHGFRIPCRVNVFFFIYVGLIP